MYGYTEVYELERLKDHTYLEIDLSIYIVDGKTGYKCREVVIGSETINPDVEILSLTSCLLSPERIEGLRLLTRLNKLSIAATSYGDEFIPIIVQMTGLQVLSLYSCHLSNRSVPPLLAMPKLLELRLRGNKEVTDEVFELFLNKTTLQKLDVLHTGMSYKKQFQIMDKYKRLNKKLPAF